MTFLPTVESDQIVELLPPVREPLPVWNVVLLDDNDHSYEYVIEMLHRLFGYTVPECYQMARTVDTTGRVVVLSTHRERAELERDRICAYGADPRIPKCKGSMTAILEQASKVSTVGE